MRTLTMADATGAGMTPSQRAINSNYRASVEITTRRGGIFWGLVLLILGGVWLIGSLGYINLDPNLMLPLLVMLGGLYLLVSKLGR